MRAIRVVDMTPIHPTHENVVFGTVAGLPTSLCVLAVASVDAHEAHVALLPTSNEESAIGPELPEPTRQALRDHIVAFSVTEGHGSARVSFAPPVGDDPALLVAAVAAVVQYSYGWDESPLIAIDVNGRSFSFRVEFLEGKSFIATAQPDVMPATPRSLHLQP